MNPIKIVIWDLDETLWRGTLSESDVETDAAVIDTVRELSGRGIINSICSKNNPAAARAELERLGIFEEFVFPEIAWSPKGPAIARILDNCRLRAANALFLDDNRSNRKEAQYYNPELEVRGPEVIRRLLDDPALGGKPDPDRRRLAQYKQLERRSRERHSLGDNRSFLEQSNIEVVRIEDLEPYRERILELIGRANQLNFTKVRLTPAAFDRLLADPDISSLGFRVRDRYGDYGLVGFAALHRAHHRLVHFVFSCRVLHLGVEQWVWHELGRPAVAVESETAVTLDSPTAPNWIRAAIDFDGARPGGSPCASDPDPSRGTKILLKGGCDLEQMAHYLSYNGLDVDEELTYVGRAGEPIHHEDTTLLLAALDRGRGELTAAIDGLPFCDADMFSTRLFDSAYAAVVYSPLMDYTRPLYRRRASGIDIPYGAVNLFAPGPTPSDERPRWLTESFLEAFARDFEHLGRIAPEQFTRNLGRLRARIPGSLILLNGVELPHPSDPAGELLERHRIMNRAIDAFVRSTDNCALLDVRRIVQQPEQLADSLRHYRREVYARMSKELTALLSNDSAAPLQPSRLLQARNIIHRRLGRLKLRWRRWAAV